MPRYVDTEHRKQSIALAAMDLIARRGLAALTLRAVAAELGGSVTLVTHYYASRAELLADLAHQLIAIWEAELEVMERDRHSDWERLEVMLHWMLPLTRAGWIQERARINLLAASDDSPVLRATFSAFDDRMRRFLSDHLSRVVEPEDLERLVDLVRVTVNGLVLAAVEHADQWPAERQLAVLRDALRAYGLEPTTSHKQVQR